MKCFECYYGVLALICVFICRFQDTSSEEPDRSFIRCNADTSDLSQYGVKNFFVTGLPEAVKCVDMSATCATVVYSRPLNMTLTCHKKFRRGPDPPPSLPLTWSFNGDEVGKKIPITHNTTNTHTFCIKPEDDGKVIKCVYKKLNSHSNDDSYKSEITINVHYEPPPTTTTPTPTTPHKQGAINSKDIKITLDLEFYDDGYYMYTCRTNKSFVFLDKSNLNIRMEASSIIDRHWCNVNDDDALHLLNINKNQDEFKLYTGTVSPSHGGIWNCTFLGYKEPKSTYIERYEYKETADSIHTTTYLKTSCVFNVTVYDDSITSTTLIPRNLIENNNNEILRRQGRTAKGPSRRKNNVNNKKSNKNTIKSKKNGKIDKKHSVEVLNVLPIGATPKTYTTSEVPGNPINTAIGQPNTMRPTENPGQPNTMRPTENPSPASRYIVYFVIAAVACLILLIVVVIAARRFCHKMRQEERKENELLYENISNENSNANQFPPNVEHTYARPYDSTTKIIDEEEPYAVASYHYQGDAAYTVPYIQDVSLLYAKPVPKSTRDMYAKPIPKSQRLKNESAYAEITPKPENSCPVATPTQLTYAEIQTSSPKPSVSRLKTTETPYSKIIGIAKKIEKRDREPGYLNVVTENSRYANADDTEYAEPAYCEVKR